MEKKEDPPAGKEVFQKIISKLREQFVEKTPPSRFYGGSKSLIHKFKGSIAIKGDVLSRNIGLYDDGLIKKSSDPPTDKLLLFNSVFSGGKLYCCFIANKKNKVYLPGYIGDNEIIQETIPLFFKAYAKTHSKSEMTRPGQFINSKWYRMGIEHVLNKLGLIIPFFPKFYKIRAYSEAYEEFYKDIIDKVNRLKERRSRGEDLGSGATLLGMYEKSGAGLAYFRDVGNELITHFRYFSWIKDIPEGEHEIYDMIQIEFSEFMKDFLAVPDDYELKITFKQYE